MSKSALAIGGLSLALIAAGFFGLRAFLTTQAQEEAAPAVELSQPKRHFRVPDPARLSDTDAAAIYERIRADMAAAYRLSRDPVATRFYEWRRYNRAPYLSDTHGDRYINNYANALASDYGRPDAGPMPVGAVLAKDSFTVTARGDVYTGPLFLMEKMPPGFAPDARDWRYTEIMPDGSLLGTSQGEGSEKVEFCISCHALAGDDQDHLFFIPEPYRLRFLQPDEGG